MASLRDMVSEYQDDLRNGIAWLAFWREGRSWQAEAFHLDLDDTLYPEDRARLAEIQAADPRAVVVNGYYSGYLGEEMNVAELAAGVRHHYDNDLNNIAPFMEAHSDELPPDVLKEAREKAHAAGLPFYERPYRGDDIDPYTYDGHMSIEDYELMQKLMEQDRERREPVSEVFSIMIDNRTKAQNDGPHGYWLDLPTTAEKLQEAMREIHISADNPQDFFIAGFSYPEDRRLAIPYDMVLAADVDELNFLAARLDTLDAAALAELNAALQNPRGGFENIGQIIDYADNVDYFVHLPDVQSPGQLGDYYLNRSGMVDMPEEWKAGIDAARFGEHIARQEQGAFTPYGYLVRSGDEWQRIHEGQPVPEEYRVMGFPQPEVLREAVQTQQAAAPTAEAPAQPQVIPIILNSKNSADRMKEITDKLETGIMDLFESDRFQAYLDTMARFHNYSFNNTILIAMQGGQLVAGYNKWRDEFHRNVKKGEKGIKIFAPAPYKVKKEVPKLDEQGQPVKDKDGNTVTEQKEIQVPAFKIVSVFDVSQTEGEPLPSLGVEELTGDVERYQDFFKALEQTSPVPMAFEDIPGGSHGYYHLTEKRIAIQENMSELQTLKTAIHEIAHAKLHAIDPEAPAAEQQNRPDSRTREVQAESVAYTVCQHYGLDTSDYSFGYVAGWSSGKDLKELKASLETIRATAHELITTIDGHLAELQQQRQAQQEQAPAQEQPQAKKPAAAFIPETVYQVRPNPYHENGGERYLLQAYVTQENGMAKMGDILYRGSEEQCRALMGRLQSGELTADQVKDLYAQQAADQPAHDSVFSKLSPEQQQEMTDSVKAMLQTLIDADVKTSGEVTQGTLDAIQTQGFVLSDDGTLQRAGASPAPEPQAEAPALDPAAEPIVTILFSESPYLETGQQMPLYEADALFAKLDAEHPGGGYYDKTDFRIDFTFQGEAHSYSGRQDFGDRDGSLIEHIRGYQEFYLHDEQWKNYVLQQQGPEALAEDQASREAFISEIIPYMELHCNLSRLEQEAQTRLASGDTLTPEETTYYEALADYVKECRPLLNQGEPLPEMPQLSDFDPSIEAYREQVMAEIEQEAADAGMTVEEYAAAGYEAPATPEPEPAPEQEAGPQAKAPEQPTKEPATSDYYYSINEGAARRAKEMNSFSDYKPGSATAEYRNYVDNAFEIAQAQKKRVDPMHHEKIDSLLDTYARKLAANMNHSFAIDARVPSILIAGGSNFPVRQKERQNAARDSNMQEWQYIQGLLDKIRSTGMGGIRQDDPQAIPKLQKKLDGLVKAQETMKAVNAYYRKHGTLDGCPHLSPDNIENLKADMASSWHYEKKPFQSWELSNNNAEIHRVRQRIESLTRAKETVYVGWEFDGGHVEANREQSRLQVFFEDKPDAEARQQLKEHGFRWAPSVGAWQRLLNGNAYYAADRIPSIQPLTGEKPTELQRSSIREQQAQMAQAQTEPEEYVYRVHAATRSDSPENLYLLQAYVPQEDGTVKIGAVLYAGTEEKCRELLDQLNTGELTQEAVKELYAKEQEQPQEPAPEQEAAPEPEPAPEQETTPEPETAQEDVPTAEPQEKPADKPLTDLQKKAVEIADRYKDLPLQGKIDIIAQAFGCKTGEIRTSPCTGKWRGTSDMSIHFDNGASLFIGNRLTPKAKTVKVQTECVNRALVRYNPEIVQATKEAALPVLLQREAKDNEIAAQKGLKPYTLLNVEFHDGADEQTGGYMGWYYVTLAVDGKICTHLETGLNYDIADGKVSDTPTRADYYPAGALKDTDVDYVFNNVGFSSASTLYTVPLWEDVRERAEQTLAERTAAEPQAGREWGFYVIADLKTWATNADQQSPIEHFATFEEAKARFDELRGQPYNKEAEDLNADGRPYAHLTLGMESKDGMSAADILQVRAGQNYLVEDFTRMERLRDDPVVLESLSRVAKEIGFDRVRPYVQENGSYKAMPDMPFSQWENPYFAVDPPEPGDSFSIYQVPAGPEGRDFRYRSYEELQAAGLAVDRKNYALVYTAPLDGKTTLENIYRTFNTDDRPADFRGHSLSVSDVVVINRGGKEEAHYCDSIGFTPVPEFMRESPIKTAEMSTEQNYNMIDGTLNNAPSMGELEARAKAGEQISLFDVAEAAKAEAQKPKQARTASKTAQRQKKPSIRAQLKAAKEEQAKKPPQREKSKELEV